MPAAQYNFFIEQGSNFDITFQYLDENNNAIVLSETADCVIFKFKPNSIGALQFPEVTYTSSSSNIQLKKISIQPNGQMSLSLKYSDTKIFAWDTAQYDLYLIRDRNSDLKKQYRLATGTISLVKVAISSEVDCEPPPTQNNNTTGSTTDSGTGTPQPTATITLQPQADTIDLCSTVCGSLDLYSTLYQYSGSGGISSLTINDNSIVSGQIPISSPLKIENIEVVISGLKHQSPQDLSLVLIPPSGSGVLLAHNQKISNITSNGAGFIFSRKALPTSYLHNTNGNDPYVNIYDKRSYHPSGNLFRAGFGHLYNHALSGLWTLQISDTDPMGSGVLSGWGIIVQYNPSQISDSSYIDNWDNYYPTNPA